jgi:phosphoribosyl-ATP pyrophosphohydrolase
MSARVKTMSEFSLRELERRIEERAGASADVSYTRQLLDHGVAHCAKKLGEESIETIMAAVGDSRERVIGEAADLLYHLLVVLKARGVSLAEVESALERRSMQSGLAEKSSRRGT